MTFHIGDVVTDTLSQGKWCGVIVHITGIRAVVRTANRDNSTSDLWYPIDWLTHVTLPMAGGAMEDTREYLQSVTGGA